MKTIICWGKPYQVVDDSLPGMHYKDLDVTETESFVAWARNQPEGVRVSGLWHPVIQDELLRSGRGHEEVVMAHRKEIEWKEKVTEGQILDRLARAVRRYKAEGKGGIDWEFFNMSQEERVAFDLFLVRVKDPLAYEPGSVEHRFNVRVMRMAEPQPQPEPEKEAS